MENGKGESRESACTALVDTAAGSGQIAPEATERPVANAAQDDEWGHFEHEPQEKRFVKRPRLPDGTLGEPAFIEYTLPGWGIANLHETFVPPLHRGKGVAERLARETFEFCKSIGLRILPTCTYLGNRFLGRNPDLLPGTLAKADTDQKKKKKKTGSVAQAVSEQGDQLHLMARRSKRKRGESNFGDAIDNAHEDIVIQARRGPVPGVPWDLSLGGPRPATIHLMPFVLPSTYCDANHPEIKALAHKIIPSECDILEAASRVRNYCRSHIKYVLDKKDRRASETLSSGVGMCTNIANLQVAILRAAGVPAGYCLVHITKETFKEMVMPATYKTINETTLHCFCASYDGGAGFLYFDATEEFKGHPSYNYFLQESFVSGETQFKGSWLRGPFTPVQANLDHLLAYQFPKKISDELRAQESEHLKNL